ncbi:hypothetical protein C8034_v009743 [Colletotrichum sidae]|uniref:WSC domain-containing protein n=1 Tax=Colletotrichum sidae TaxID=1347389 RepID=A0A4R8Q1F9_9PEZI|nr:hypothetical protein C8034_v009743 [Colletotrichum sidae]
MSGPYCSCSYEGNPPIDRAEAVDDPVCNIPCSRNTSAPCGARGIPSPQTIYQVNDPPTPAPQPGWDYYGCLSANSGPRGTFVEVPGGVGNPVVCQDGCAALGGSYVEMYSFYDGTPTCRCLTAATAPLSGGSFQPEGCTFNCPSNSSAACGGYVITDRDTYTIRPLLTAYIKKTPENPQILFRYVVVGDVFVADFNLGCVDGSVLSRHVHDINVVNRDIDGFNVVNRDFDDISVINRDIHVVDTRDLFDRRDAIDISHPIKRGDIDITINVFTVDIRVVVNDTGSFNVIHGRGRVDGFKQLSLQ